MAKFRAKNIINAKQMYLKGITTCVCKFQCDIKTDADKYWKLLTALNLFIADIHRLRIHYSEDVFHLVES